MKINRSAMKYRHTLFVSLTVATLLSGASTLAVAERVSSYSIEQQQRDIHMRIQQGIDTGLITQDEAEKLSRRERDIRFREARIKNDNYTSPQERDSLQRDLNALRADVERKLSNNRLTAQPQGYLPDIAGREEQIGKRIDYGISVGLITRTEAQRLRQRENDIYRRETGFRADGRVTPSEREQLQRDLDKLTRDVDRLLNNGRVQRR
ncbi:MAG TPA: hypothetical protein VN114_06080 [Oxalicibacterium sp.]|uniref:hypothetical protein n=1 Tax=Oxalicibacterium sp. TaxID=2766525 RepID=UPI002C0DC7A3|nr:hypothetical protein [Oxalicibacterium sp.]HWU98061.1 hypothetical protein [Oxalicibacterium sp.]